MRKYFLLLTFALLGFMELSAQPIVSPYQYRKSWFVHLQTGGSFLSTEYGGTFRDYKRHDRYSFYNEAIVGYYFTDAHEMRVSFAYAPRTSLLSPNVYGFHPYTFRDAQVFVDYVVNWHPLGENNTPYNPQLYVGLGGAVTYDFSTPEVDPENPGSYPAEDLAAQVHPLNIVPGLRIGVLFEYDFRNNFGLTVDLGGQFFHDRFNGQDPDRWPVDMQLNATFGVVYHFKRRK